LCAELGRDGGGRAGSLDWAAGSGSARALLSRLNPVIEIAPGSTSGSAHAPGRRMVAAPPDPSRGPTPGKGRCSPAGGLRLAAGRRRPPELFPPTWGGVRRAVTEGEHAGLVGRDACGVEH